MAYQGGMRVYEADAFYNLPVRPELAYIELESGMDKGLHEIVDMDVTLNGEEYCVAFLDFMGQMNWVNATRKNILVEEYDPEA